MSIVVDRTNSPAADQNTRERSLIAIVDELARELHPQHIRRGNTSLSSRLEKDLGIDSLGRTELVLRLERAFGVRLPIKLVGEADIVGDLLHALEQAGQSGATIAAAPPAPSLTAVAAATEAQNVAGCPGMARRRASRPPSRHGARGRHDRPRHAELWRACKDSPHGGRGLDRARHHAGRSGGAHAADGRRILRRVLRHSLCGRDPGADLSADATLADRGLCPPPGRNPPQCRRPHAHHGARRAQARVRCCEGLPTPWLRSRASRAFRAHAAEVALPNLQDGSATALIQYTSGSTGDPEGRRAQSRQSARQYPRDRPRDRRELRRCLRELAAALSRHGAHRRVAGLPLFRRAALCHVAARLPGASAKLAVGDPSLSRHHVRGPQLCVRAVSQQDRRCEPARAWT